MPARLALEAEAGQSTERTPPEGARAGDPDGSREGEEQMAKAAADFSDTTNYYKEYWRVYLQNEQLLEGLQDVQADCLELQRKINAIQVRSTQECVRNTTTRTLTPCLLAGGST